MIVAGLCGIVFAIGVLLSNADSTSDRWYGITVVAFVVGLLAAL
jgi:hypothetical protein